MTSFSAGCLESSPLFVWVLFSSVCGRRGGCFTGWLSCGAVAATPRPGVSAAVYLAAYLLVCWPKAAADCGDTVSLHVVGGFPTLWQNAEVCCAEISDIVMSFMTNENAQLWLFLESLSLWKFRFLLHFMLYFYSIEVIEFIWMF